MDSSTTPSVPAPRRRGRPRKGRIDEFGRECSKCGEYLAWENFYRNTAGVNGYNAQCIPCAIASSHTNYWANVEERRAAQRVRNTEYLRRTDRQCREPGCLELAPVNYYYCRPHNNEHALRKYYAKRSGQEARLLERQGGYCPHPLNSGCGQPILPEDEIEIDHRIPRSFGKTQAERKWLDREENLSATHKICNRVKHDNQPEVYSLLIPGWYRRPAVVPALSEIPGLAPYLTDEELAA